DPSDNRASMRSDPGLSESVSAEVPAAAGARAAGMPVLGGPASAFALALTMFVEAVGYGVVAPTLPFLARNAGAGEAQIGFLVGRIRRRPGARWPGQRAFPVRPVRRPVARGVRGRLRRPARDGASRRAHDAGGPPQGAPAPRGPGFGRCDLRAVVLLRGHRGVPAAPRR